jgi:hypothetical protein
MAPKHAAVTPSSTCPATTSIGLGMTASSTRRSGRIPNPASAPAAARATPRVGRSRATAASSRVAAGRCRPRSAGSLPRPLGA